MCHSLLHQKYTIVRFTYQKIFPNLTSRVLPLFSLCVYMSFCLSLCLSLCRSLCLSESHCAVALDISVCLSACLSRLRKLTIGGDT